MEERAGVWRGSCLDRRISVRRCTGRASVGGASSKGKLVLWVSMIVHGEKKYRKDSPWWLKVVCAVSV